MILCFDYCVEPLTVARLSYHRILPDLTQVSKIGLDRSCPERVFFTERIYILSLGSQQGNRHVHWHVAPLPPGVPLEMQQFEALTIENDVLDLSDAEMAALAARLRQRLVESQE